MEAAPIWFGSKDRPLAGWLHLPAGGRARGGVVLCPTLGIEALTAHAAYRAIAVQLAAAGVAVLRFDYRGTGDSAGMLAADGSVEGFLDDVAIARAHLERCGVGPVALAGLRLGATLAAVAAARQRPAALALWDPYSRGRAFVREQQALKAFSLGEAPEPGGDGVELASLHLPGRLAAELGRLSLAELRLGAADCLVLRRARHGEDAVLERFVEGATVEHRSVRGQEQFLDVGPGSSILPEATMDGLARWLADRFAGEPGRPVGVLGRDAVRLATPDGPVAERAVVFGEHRAFGIVTEPVAGPAAGPAVVLASIGTLPHVGPGRLWVELARSLAASGRRVLRFDVGGIGDSPTHDGRTPRVAYPVDGVDDVLEAAAVASPGDPRDVVLVGICSGAFHSLRAALALQPAGVVLVNPIYSLVPEELQDPLAREGATVAPPNAVLSWMRHNRLVVRIAHQPRLDAVRNDPRLARALDAHLPEAAWRLLMKAGFVPSAGEELVSLNAQGTDALVVCGQREARPYRRCRRLVRALRATGRFRLEILEWIDHSLFGTVAATTVRSLLEAHLDEQFPLPGLDGPAPGLAGGEGALARLAAGAEHGAFAASFAPPPVRPLRPAEGDREA